jgi:ankyrin repeat protein
MDANMRFKTGETLLIAAARLPDDRVEMVKLLLLRGADVNFVMEERTAGLEGSVSALSEAVRAGNAHCVRSLLDAGAHTDEALKIASAMGNAGMVTLLSHYGATRRRGVSFVQPGVQLMPSSRRPLVQNPLYNERAPAVAPGVPAATGPPHVNTAAASPLGATYENPLRDVGAAPMTRSRAAAIGAEWFASLDSDKDGFITGDEARDFFLQSDIPSETLAEIWASFAKKKKGHLDVDEFTHMFSVTKTFRDKSLGESQNPFLI